MSKRVEIKSWEDPLGQTYTRGDPVSVSVINGRSPRTVYGIVEAIYTTNAKGEPLVECYYGNDPETGKWAMVKTPTCAVKVKVYNRTRGGNIGVTGSYTYKLPENITKLGLTQAQFLNLFDV